MSILIEIGGTLIDTIRYDINKGHGTGMTVIFTEFSFKFKFKLSAQRLGK